VAYSSFIALVKFRYHITFVNVVFGALIFAPVIDTALLLHLIGLYVSFNVLLYGGIYTLNDLADRHADRRHPLKRLRPIASGAVSPRAAFTFGACLVLLGLTVGVSMFSSNVLWCFAGVLLINGVYSAGGREIQYLDVVLNALPHPTRFLMGALAVGHFPRRGHLVAITLLAIGLSCLRRHVEQDVAGSAGGRSTLQRYAGTQLEVLGFACVALLAVVSAYLARPAPGFTAVVLTAGVVLICGGHRIGMVRGPLRTVWMR